MKIMMIGAHPDDCDFYTGGTAAKLARRGHAVHFLSVTNGNAGHYAQKGEELARRRYEETQASAKVLGITYEVLDNDDGRLEATLENRETLIRKIRAFAPDVLITNRPNDYHADHRYTSLLVQDASFLLQVPNICPDVPALPNCPIILLWGDNFREPNPFRPDIVVPIDDVIDTFVEVAKCHASQTLEWLPWVNGDRHFPSLPLEKRLAMLEDSIRNHPPRMSDAVYTKLAERYGKDVADRIQRAESYQLSEYGSPLNEEVRSLFEEL